MKLFLVRYVSNNLFGWIIGKIYRNSIPFNGVHIYTNFTRIQNKTIADIFFGIYERAEIDQVNSYLDPTVDVIELGGSVGVGSLQIRRRLEENRKLLVVEADPELVDISRYNFKRNKMENNVRIVNKAIDYSGNEYVCFSVNQSSLSGHVSEECGNENEDTISVATSTLSKLIEQYEFSEYALVSDIEGMEIPIFIEDKNALANCKQIFCEIDGVRYKDVDYNVDDIVNIVCNLGFKVVERYYNCVAFTK